MLAINNEDIVDILLRFGAGETATTLRNKVLLQIASVTETERSDDNFL
jgi:hypothetical protein